ncbi:MAG TPA: hypothetical protein VFO16_04255, partial [Pseudonocardiaceae bacterium]|nr:hypothetical protein [Pseudonocardiaceae bacterium]
MSFTAEDEDAFYIRRDEVLDDYAAWLASSNVANAEAYDAGVALDWKWAYQDGELGRWTVADLDEFLLGWCPRKLTMPSEECAEFPASIRAFMTFLAARGLLAPGSGTPSQLQRWCDHSTSRFVRKMTDPANYGLAKGLLAGAGMPGPGIDLGGLAPLSGGFGDIDGFDEFDEEPIAVGPATLPDPAQHEESAAAAPVLAQMRVLWEFCADPGRPLTRKGHLRMADARHLATVLDTGDDQRSPRSAADLPVLNWLIELALETRVLRQHQDRLMSVERWRELSAVEALDRLVEHALGAGLSDPASPEETWIYPIREVIDESVGRLLAELIDCQAGGTPMPIDELTGFMAEIMSQAFAGLPESALGAIRGWVRTQIDRLALLGVVTLHDQIVELTPAGVVIAVALAEDLGLTVLRRPDPVGATAGDLVTLIEHMRPDAWLADARAWVAHQGAEPAARELVSVITDPSTPMPVAVAVLTQLDGLVGEHAVPAIKTMLDGPRDSVAVQALLA